jgi:hypothetical protein
MQMEISYIIHLAKFIPILKKWPSREKSEKIVKYLLIDGQIVNLESALFPTGLEILFDDINVCRMRNNQVKLSNTLNRASDNILIRCQIFLKLLHRINSDGDFVH